MSKEMKKEEENEEKDVFEEGESQEKKSSTIKNLTSLLIIVTGLFVGSIFIDIVQLVSGEGVSRSVLGQSDIFEIGERTWVAYEEPIARVSVLTDENCEECDPSQALLFLRRYLPTLLAEEVSIDSAQGERIIEEANVNTLPAFVFDKSIVDTSFYLQAAQIFQSDEKESLYALDVAQLGLPVGKYLELPEVGEDAIVVGNPDAPVTIVEFSDFQCPYCQLLHPSIRQALEEFDGQIRFVYKHLPLSFHAQAENAALASECANEQGKFIEYADTLFENQAQWGETEGTASFKRYASTLGLNTTTFNQCLDSQKYQEKIASDVEEAQKFGISGTPGTFVGSQFLGGAAQYESFKAMIEQELGGELQEGESDEEDAV